MVLCFTHSTVCVSVPGSQLIPSCGFPLGVHVLVPYARVSLSGRLCLDRCRLSSLRKGKENGVVSYTSLSLLSPLVVLPWNFCPYIFLLAVSTSGILLVPLCLSSPCLFPLSQCRERRSIFLESQTFLGLEGTRDHLVHPLPSGT